MKPGSGYIPAEDIRYPLRGLNVSVPSTQIDPGFTPECLNMQIKDGVAFKRSGYAELVAGGTLVGTVLALVDFELLDGSKKLVALTTRRQYKYNSSTIAWDDITTLHGQTFNLVSSTATSFVVATDLTTVFTAGSKFLIQGTVYNNGEYTVVSRAYSAPNTTITIAGASATEGAVGTITNNVFNIVSTDATSDWIKIAGDYTAIMVAGVKLRVAGTVANDGEYTVASSSFGGGNTQINITTLVGASGGAAGTVGIITELTTVTGDVINWEIGTDTSTHRLYMTNGRDRVRWWDGTSSMFTIWSPVYTNFVTCKCIKVFFDHMMLGNVTTSSNEPKLVVWSDTANFNSYEAGSAGADLIPTLRGSIQEFELLGDRMIVYSEDSLAGVTFIGFPVTFSFEVLLPDGVRLISPRAAVGFGSALLYVTQENIYFFDGSRGVRPVGNYIRKLYKQALNHAYASQLFCFNDVAKRTIYIIVPSSATDHLVLILDYDVYDLNQFIWTKAVFTDLPSTMGFYARRTSGKAWSALVGSWSDWFGIWTTEGTQTNFPVRLLGSGSRVFAMDETIITDDTDDVLARYESKDWVVPEHLSVLGRWIEIEANLAGTAVTVSYSTDLGNTWTEVYGTPHTLDGDMKHYNFPVDTVSRTFRVKFESLTYFALDWVRPWVQSTSSR